MKIVKIVKIVKIAKLTDYSLSLSRGQTTQVHFHETVATNLMHIPVDTAEIHTRKIGSISVISLKIDYNKSRQNFKT